MGAIRLTQFGGIVPRTSERLIPDNAAQSATNCRLSNGELIPFRAPQVVFVSNKAGPFKSIYRAYDSGAYEWMAWQQDVDVVKAPLYGPAVFCYTGDGTPSIATMAQIPSGAAYTLGTPQPITAPVVTPSGGAAANVSRYYTYTFYCKLDGLELEGANSPLSALITGKPDGTWVISGMDASPPNSGTVTGVFAAGETTFTSTSDTFLRSGEQVTIAATLLTVTVLTSKIFKVTGDFSAATTWVRKTPFVGTIYKRLYRSAGTTAQFQLVAEDLTATTYSDTLTDAQIPGDELISADWAMPPVDLKGLFLLPSGSLGGFVKNKLLFSEPNQPHAWPSSYALTADHDIVAAESFGSGIGVTTGSTPYIVNGVEPGQMSMTAWNEVLPCTSKRSVVSTGDAVLYASPAGLIALNGGGAQFWSRPYFTEREWSLRAPSTMFSAMAGRRLYVGYIAEGNVRILIFSLLGDTSYLSETVLDAADLYADAVTGGLYFSSAIDNKVYEFDPDGGYPMTMEWMSKEIILPRPHNLGAAKVNFNTVIPPAVRSAILAEIARITALNAPKVATGAVKGAWNAKTYNTIVVNGSELLPVPQLPPDNAVSFSLYAGGKFRFGKTVTDSKPFNLPSGYKADTVTVQVSSQCDIKSIELADTKQALSAS